MNCDPIARWYRWLEYGAFGHALERRRAAFLGDLENARRALVVGDGDGRALKTLLGAAPHLTVDYVDLSVRMLDLARRRAGSDRVAYYCADARTFPLPDHEYDLIVSHFFLDCLDSPDLASLTSSVRRAARPDARWLVSEFRDNSWWAGVSILALYGFFRCATGLRTNRLFDHHGEFARQGFQLARRETAWRGFLASELWELRGPNESTS